MYKKRTIKELGMIAMGAYGTYQDISVTEYMEICDEARKPKSVLHLYIKRLGNK